MKEALAQLTTTTIQFEKDTTTSIQALAIHMGQIITMLANESKESSPSNMKKEFEEAEAHKEEESCTEEELAW